MTEGRQGQNRVRSPLFIPGLITLCDHTLVIEAWGELWRIAEFDPTYLQLSTERLDEPTPTARSGCHGKR